MKEKDKKGGVISFSPFDSWTRNGEWTLVRTHLRVRRALF
jgi:hypothetical protein